jgi:ABC-type sugar transport system ATPase subunit
MTLADRIAVFMDGRIAQVGTPREVYARPRTMAVAGFVGTPQMNLLPGTWQAGTVTVAGHTLPVAPIAAERRDVVLGVRPSDLRLASSGLPAHIERIEDLGDSAIVSLSMAGQMLKLKTDRLPAAADGDNVFVGFAPETAHMFDPKDGQRL